MLEVVTNLVPKSGIPGLSSWTNAGREIDENIFSHENSECPPSFTSAGHMYGGTKSEIMKCLIEFEVEFPTSAPTAYILILDGAYVMQSLRPGKSSTFKE